MSKYGIRKKEDEQEQRKSKSIFEKILPHITLRS